MVSAWMGDGKITGRSEAEADEHVGCPRAAGRPREGGESGGPKHPLSLLVVVNGLISSLPAHFNYGALYLMQLTTLPLC